MYFAESINSRDGFWGWPCPSYFVFVFGRCPPKEPQILMGEHINSTARGVHLVITDSVSPFAVGKYTGPLVEIFVRNSEQYPTPDTEMYRKEVNDFFDFDDLSENLADTEFQIGNSIPGCFKFSRELTDFDSFSNCMNTI